MAKVTSQGPKGPIHHRKQMTWNFLLWAPVVVVFIVGVVVTSLLATLLPSQLFDKEVDKMRPELHATAVATEFAGKLGSTIAAQSTITSSISACSVDCDIIMMAGMRYLTNSEHGIAATYYAALVPDARRAEWEQERTVVMGRNVSIISSRGGARAVRPHQPEYLPISLVASAATAMDPHGTKFYHMVGVDMLSYPTVRLSMNLNGETTLIHPNSTTRTSIFQPTLAITSIYPLNLTSDTMWDAEAYTSPAFNRSIGANFTGVLTSSLQVDKLLPSWSYPVGVRAVIIDEQATSDTMEGSAAGVDVNEVFGECETPTFSSTNTWIAAKSFDNSAPDSPAAWPTTANALVTAATSQSSRFVQSRCLVVGAKFWRLTIIFLPLASTMYSAGTIAVIGAVVTTLLLAVSVLAVRHRTQKWQFESHNQNTRGLQSKIAQAAFEKALHQTSHRLLNPLQRLVAHAEMLNEWQSGQGDAASAYVSSIASAIWTASHQIRRIIGDMADYGRIQQKTLAQHATQVDIAALMAEIHSSTEYPADFKVNLQIAREVPAFICIDRDRFEQIVANVIAFILGVDLHQALMMNISATTANGSIQAIIVDFTCDCDAKMSHFAVDVPTDPALMLSPAPSRNSSDILDGLMDANASTRAKVDESRFSLCQAQMLADALGGSVRVRVEGGKLVARACIPCLDPAEVAARREVCASPTSGKDTGNPAPATLRTSSTQGSPLGMPKTDTMPSSSRTVTEHTLPRFNAQVTDTLSDRRGLPLSPCRTMSPAPSRYLMTRSVSDAVDKEFNNGLAIRSPPERPPLRMHLLIVDDELSNVRILQRISDRIGCTNVPLDDGIHIVPLLQSMGMISDHSGAVPGAIPSVQIRHERPFDAILLDLVMRSSDGAEVCKMLREVYHVTIPIIAVTANGKDIPYLRSCGFNDVVHKPVNSNSIHTALVNVKKTPMGGTGSSPLVEYMKLTRGDTVDRANPAMTRMATKGPDFT